MFQVAALSPPTRFGLFGIIVLIFVAGLFSPIVYPELNTSHPPPQLLLIALILSSLALLIFIGVFPAISFLAMAALVTLTGARILTADQFIQGTDNLISLFKALIT